MDVIVMVYSFHQGENDMENRNAFGFLIQYDMEELAVSLKKAKRTAYRYYGFLVLAGLLGICFAVKTECINILSIWIGISVTALCGAGLLEEAENMRNRKKLAEMLQAGDKILDLHRCDGVVQFEMEHRRYGEDKTTFALSREKMTFYCEKMYTTDSTLTVLNLNHLVLTIPYLEA